MLIKKVSFALTALLLAIVAVVVLWRYQVEVEPYLASAGLEAERASSHFQIIFLLSILTLGLLLLFFVEMAIFRPLANLSRVMDNLVNHNPSDSMPVDFGMFGDLTRKTVLLIDDMVEQDAKLKEKERNLNHRLRVEEALAKVARNLLRDPVKGVSRSLRILGRNLDTDVVSYWELTRDGDNMVCIGTFRDKETGEFSGEYDFTAPVAPWISEAIHYDRHLVIDDVGKVPADLDVVREFISEYDLRSFLGVPLKVPDSNLGGFVAFGNISSVKHWSKEDLRALEVVAELLVDHIKRSITPADQTMPKA